MRGITSHLLDPFRMLRSFGNWAKRMDSNPGDMIPYTTRYQEAILKYAEDEYCANHRDVVGNQLETVPSSNLVPSATVAGSHQTLLDQ